MADDSDTPRKTLTLKPGGAAPAQDAAPRKRAGARAKQAAQLQRQRPQDAAAAEQQRAPQRPRPDRPDRPAGRGGRPERSAAGTSRQGQRPGSRPQGQPGDRPDSRPTRGGAAPSRGDRPFTHADRPRRPASDDSPRPPRSPERQSTTRERTPADRPARDWGAPRRPSHDRPQRERPPYERTERERTASDRPARDYPARERAQYDRPGDRPNRDLPGRDRPNRERTGYNQARQDRPDRNAAPRTPEFPRPAYRRPQETTTPAADGAVRTPNEARRLRSRPSGPVSARAARFDASEIFAIFAPCPQGLEQALADELQGLGFSDARPARAGCDFHADWTGVLRANLCSRLATRILVRLAHAPVSTEDDILALAHDTPWEQWFGPRQTLRVDTSAIRSPMQSLQYCNLRVKDGICDRLREREGERPDIDTVRPDARVHLFLDETSATLYLDTTGESLFKRGWRLDKGEAPLRENLASGLLALSGWQPGQPLLDPFCGSGTILIEAAGIALGVPPGIWRPFGFERLRNHDERRWRDLKEETRASMHNTLDAPLIGCDLSADAIDAARANAKRAWLTPDAIDFRVGDALSLPPPAPQGWLITNPPYGERLESAQIEFWRAWSEHLKRQYAGWQIGAITSDLDLPSHLRLKPRRRIPLHNGALDCRLFLFDMVSEGYRQ